LNADTTKRTHYGEEYDDLKHDMIVVFKNTPAIFRYVPEHEAVSTQNGRDVKVMVEAAVGAFDGIFSTCYTKPGADSLVGTQPVVDFLVNERVISPDTAQPDREGKYTWLPFPEGIPAFLNMGRALLAMKSSGNQWNSQLQRTFWIPGPMVDAGFEIVNTLVVDLTPDSRVREAMNEINANVRIKMACKEKGEAEKLVIVKKAEADMVGKEFAGKGVADMRNSIIKGLTESMADVEGVTEKLPKKAILEMVLITQYFDVLKDIGCNKGTKTCFMNVHQDSKALTANSLRSALMEANTLPQQVVGA